MRGRIFHGGLHRSCRSFRGIGCLTSRNLQLYLTFIVKLGQPLHTVASGYQVLAYFAWALVCAWWMSTVGAPGALRVSQYVYAR